MRHWCGLGWLWVAVAAAGLAGCTGRLGEGQAGYARVESEAEPEAEGSVATEPSVGRGRGRAAAPQAGEEWLTGFELTERSGEKLSSQDLKGQPYVVGFFFTLCPSICVNQNGKVQELQEQYAGQPIRFLSISCDPEVDRPEVLAEYAERFKADKDQWLFLTGDLEYLRRVGAEMYFLPVERRFHAEKFVLVDAEGKNVGFYSWSDPVQFKELQRDIDRLLEQGGVDVADAPSDAQPQAAGASPPSAASDD